MALACDHRLLRAVVQPQNHLCAPRHHQIFPAMFPRLRLPRFRTFQFLLRAASISSPGAAEFPEDSSGNAQKMQKEKRSLITVEEEFLEPAELADPDSFFCEFNGIQIHHKICHQEVTTGEEEEEEESSSKAITKIGLPIVLLHGFGASVFSWDQVMRPLARITGSKVLGFDRPAFGLTSRVSYFTQPGLGPNDAVPPNPYSMAFSVMATLSFIDMLGAHKSIIIGHSAGCLVAVNTYFESPERVAALILVAPAILAPFVPPRKASKGSKLEERNQVDAAESSSATKQNPSLRTWKGFLGLCKNIASMVVGMFQGMRDMVGSLYVKTLSAILRSSFAALLVRTIINRFGVSAIRNAWYDATQVTDHVLQGYTKPLKTKGWEKALLEYTLAMLTDSASETKPPLTKRLSEISCPVLIITGDTDRLVPSWNAERLSLAIPGSTLEVIKNCGHLPHEEKVEEFLGAVERFLKNVSVNPQGQLLQPAAS